MDSIDRPTLSPTDGFTAPAASAVPPLSPQAARPGVLPAPSVGEFLRQVFALGRRSILPALPILVLLYFYRFGMGLYMIFSGDVTSPMGYPST
ncbi:MAG: hypothetical protein AAB011_03570, partial [Candidatus Eisenbacteria bacterium]